MHSRRLKATPIRALEMTGPHDKFVKQMFSNVKHAAIELRAVLPPALLTQLDLSSLRLCPGSFVDRRLRQVHSDLLYSIQLDTHQAYIYVLLEHQSTPDATMPFRLLEYLVKIWRDHVERVKPTSEPGLPLPLIIPIVLHHGENGWNTSRQFHDLFDPELLGLPNVAALVPSFRFLLDDLTQVNDAALQSRARQQAELLVPLVLWALRDGRSHERLLSSLVRWAPVVQAVWQSNEGPRTLAALWNYFSMVTPDLSEQDLADGLAAALPESQGAIMATLAEQWMKQGLERGLDQGRRQTLARLLELKFGRVPDSIQARLAAASSDEVTRWTERVLTSESLEDVLDHGNTR